ncbi:hypothetical protein EPN15_05675 [Patescibacteria group bacterium]|nr:MAG: hypothetical protein EPN15_05675 [Patescibacteria group bacterium]
MGEEEVEISMKYKVFSIKESFVFLFFCLAVSGIFSFEMANESLAAGGILINEIFFNPSGSDPGKEFVELYNQDSNSYDLKNWSLKLSDGTSLAKIGSIASDQTTIPANGYFLVGLNNYDQTPTADVKRSASLPNSAKTVQLFDNLNGAIDSASYDASVSEGQSWTRTSPQLPTPQNSGLPVSVSANANSSTTGANSNSDAPTNTNSGNINTNASSSLVLSSIIFNEVYPNPPDESTEFIELKNASGFAGSPLGWKIKDASGDEYNLPDKEIANGALWVIPKLESGISLNNDGETLSLINPAGAIAATLSIPAAPESQSYARSGAESFEWTIALTAGVENVFTQAISAPVEIAAPANTNSSASNINASNSNGSVNANTSTSANTNSSKITIDFSVIKLSELMPNPAGDDADGEWIELYNGGDKDIDLAGGSLSDASGKAYTIPKNTNIAAKSHKVFYRKLTGIVLNNDQDAIDLKDSSGKKIDSVSYADGAEGKSYALGKNGWLWSDPTPDKTNVQAADTGANANENTNSNGIKRVGATINEAKNAKSGAIITVSGIVTAAFGEIAKNTFYIQDDTGGMAVVLESTALEISRGDFVVVKGKMKTSGGEKILSADDEKQITVQSSGNNAAAWQMNIADIDSQSLGLFIGVNGKAVELIPKGFIIDDGSGSLAILPPGETSAEKGQIASVQGILKKTKDGIVLILRDKNDFISGNVLGESDQKNLSIAGDGKKYDIIIQLLIIIVTLLVGGYAARKYLQKYSYATSDTKPAEESKKDRDSDSGFGL